MSGSSKAAKAIRDSAQPKSGISMSFSPLCPASNSRFTNTAHRNVDSNMVGELQLIVLPLHAGPSQALGIDTLQQLFPTSEGKPLENAAGAATKRKLQDAEDAFQSSDLLKRLKEQTTSNGRK